MSDPLKTWWIIFNINDHDKTTFKIVSKDKPETLSECEFAVQVVQKSAYDSIKMELESLKAKVK